MKKLLTLIIVTFALFYSGCSNDSGGTGTDPFGPGGGGTGNVTFTITVEQGQQGINFRLKPSQSITVTTITVSLPAQNFTDPITNPNPDEVFDTANGFVVGEYTGTASGQQWTFAVQGKIGSSTGTAYNVTSNFTIP